MRTACSISLVFCSVVCNAALSPAAENWFDNYATALAAAKANSEPLLIILEQPSQPLQRAEQERAARENGLLEPYTLCRINVTTPLGKRVAEVFKADEIPYTVITDRQANSILYRKSGRFSDSDWAATLITFRSSRVRPPARTVAQPSAREVYVAPPRRRAICFS